MNTWGWKALSSLDFIEAERRKTGGCWKDGIFFERHLKVFDNVYVVNNCETIYLEVWIFWNLGI